MLWGRDTELERLDAWLDGGVQRIAIVGPGGAGKTELARHWARRRRPSHFVSLVGAERRSEVLRRVSTALGLRGGDPDLDATARRVGDYLATGAPQLLVLDNSEGISLAELQDVVDWTFEPGVAVLFTSRWEMDSLVEITLPLGGLPPNEARRLFNAVRRDTSPGPSDEAALDRIGRAVDHLPLGILIAAKLAAGRSLAELVDALRTGGLDSERLSASVSASWKSLQPSVCCSLARVAALPGGFDSEAWGAVSEVGAEAALAEVLATSLVHRLDGGAEDRARFGLYEIARRYAQRSHPDEVAAGAREFVTHYGARGVRWYREQRGRDPWAAQRELASETDNVVALADLARTEGIVAPGLWIALDLIYQGQGAAPVHRTALERAVALARDARDAEALAIALALHGRFLFLRGHYRMALGAIEESVGLLAHGPSRWIHTFCRRAHSHALWAVGRTADAEATARTEIEQGQERGWDELVRIGRYNLGTAQLVSGAVARARTTLLALLADLNAGEEPMLEALARANLGFVESEAGRHALAAEYASDAVGRLSSMGDGVLALKTRVLLAQSLAAMGRRQEAELEAAHCAVEAERWGELEAQVHIATLRAEWTPDPAAAVSHLARARLTAERSGEAGLLDMVVRAEAQRGVEAGGTVGRVAGDASTIWSGSGVATPLHNRPALQRIVSALLNANGAPLDVAALFEAGWPDEQAHPDAAAGRVYTAIKQLRQAGLRDALLRRDGGYALLPALFQIAGR